MGLISFLLGLGTAAGRIGKAAGGVAEVWQGNQKSRDEHEHKEHLAALEQLAKEFQASKGGWFDQVVDALNRLPRPLLALGTLCLFVYAMAAPISFAMRMQGLALVPEPLWWLLGAIVSFYFGARELHYFRRRTALQPETIESVMSNMRRIEELSPIGQAEADIPAMSQPDAKPMRLVSETIDNPVVAEWRKQTGIA